MIQYLAGVHILLYYSSNFQTLSRASIYILFPIIHEKLSGELNLEMETTSNRLDFVQVCFASSAAFQYISSRAFFNLTSFSEQFSVHLMKLHVRQDSIS